MWLKVREESDHFQLSGCGDWIARLPLNPAAQ
jgi:hypothetical protein